jgi:DNA mismatch repair protein MutS
MLFKIELQAGNSILKYLEFTQIDKVPHLAPPSKFSMDSRMNIDTTTRRSLELVDTLSGDKKKSLLAIIDRTITSPGARMLSSYLSL